jgi:hypothetical protein
MRVDRRGLTPIWRYAGRYVLPSTHWLEFERRGTGAGLRLRQ